MTYFTYFPYIYEITTILDPNFKMKNISKLIGDYYHFVGLLQSDGDNYVGNCRKLLGWSWLWSGRLGFGSTLTGPISKPINF